MSGSLVKKVVIAGGGTAGWLAAMGLARQLGSLIDITLVESEEIGTVGVGEATIPTQKRFHQLMGIDERAFVGATNATFKLGIEFENWARQGDCYFHSFGQMGQTSWIADFHHFWLEAQAQGIAGPITDYSYETQAAKANKFYTDEKSQLNYAYHLDASLYAKFLRGLSEERGVTRIEGKIAAVEQDAESGFITALTLESGQRIEGDFFIDCTGFRGLLIEETLKTGFEDWSHWLPTDRAWAVQTASTGPAIPYTRAVAHDAGWRWRIPLQNRVGNGLVFSSAYLGEDAARERFLSLIEGDTLTEPRLIRYRTGARKQAWTKNCVAIGLSSGFVEPLESTSIHLIQIAITRLIKLFPFSGVTPSLRTHFNVQAQTELEKVRDFIILHYKLTERDDSAFWRDRAAMDIPDTLAERIALFEENGHAYQWGSDLFLVDSWLQVMLGQRRYPRGHHPIARTMPEGELEKRFAAVRTNLAAAVDRLPFHADFVKSYVQAEQPPASVR